MTEKANELPFPEGGDRKSTGRAELARDEAMERVERSHEDWIAWNRTPILAAARALGEFTTDDLWEATISAPREKRAMGPLVKSFQREGLIRPTGSYRKSREVGCHARPKAVWRYVER